MSRLNTSVFDNFVSFDVETIKCPSSHTSSNETYVWYIYVIGARKYDRAKAKGVRFGRKAVLNDKQLQSLKAEAKGWSGSMSDLGKKYDLSRSSVYRLLRPAQEVVAT